MQEVVIQWHPLHSPVWRVSHVLAMLKSCWSLAVRPTPICIHMCRMFECIPLGGGLQCAVQSFLCLPPGFGCLGCTAEITFLLLCIVQDLASQPQQMTDGTLRTPGVIDFFRILNEQVRGVKQLGVDSRIVYYIIFNEIVTGIITTCLYVPKPLNMSRLPMQLLKCSQDFMHACKSAAA